jgi:hypothetical protein
MNTEECSICCELLYNSYKLECNHQFHENCLENCKKDVCPLCRKPFNLITDVYILELTISISINKYILFKSFPPLQRETFKVDINSVNSANSIIILCFQCLEIRDKWFTFFNCQKEITKCTKKDIKVNIRKIV